MDGSGACSTTMTLGACSIARECGVTSLTRARVIMALGSSGASGVLASTFLFFTMTPTLIIRRGALWTRYQEEANENKVRYLLVGGDVRPFPGQSQAPPIFLCAALAASWGSVGRTPVGFSATMTSEAEVPP